MHERRGGARAIEGERDIYRERYRERERERERERRYILIVSM